MSYSKYVLAVLVVASLGADGHEIMRHEIKQRGDNWSSAGLIENVIKTLADVTDHNEKQDEHDDSETDEAATSAKCSNMELVDSWSHNHDACTLGDTFGCSDNGKTMWTKGDCSGMFSVNGMPTRCGQRLALVNRSHDRSSFDSEPPHTCEAGRMPPPDAECQQMFLTSFFTSVPDWQWHIKQTPSFSKIANLYRTVLDLGLNMTVIHDALPDDLTSKYRNERWNWEKVRLADYDTKLGVNDVRFFFFKRLMEQHPEWKHVFVMDAFDVSVKMNPCPFLQEGKLYIGSEPNMLSGNDFMAERYKELGGKYQSWFRKQSSLAAISAELGAPIRAVTTRHLHHHSGNALLETGHSGTKSVHKVASQTKIMNAGLMGGHRDILLDFFGKMVEVLSDPELAARKKHQEIHVNMGALNYVIHHGFEDKLVTGPPIHSVFKAYETDRDDVWFIHKFFF